MKNARTHIIASGGKVLVLCREYTGTETIYEIPALIFHPGSVSANPKQLLNIISSMNDDDLIIKSREGYIDIEQGSGVFSIEDFGDVPEITATGYIDNIIIYGKELIKTFKDVGFAMSNEPNRKYINGVNINIKGEFATFAATTPIHLAVSKIKCYDDGRLYDDINITIPPNVVKILQTSVKPDNIVDIKFNDDYMSFTFGDCQITVKKIEEKFIDYNQVIPTNYVKNAVIDGLELLSAINKMIAINPYNQTANIDIKDGQIKMEAENREIKTRGRIEMPCEYSGEVFQTAVDVNLLKDIIKHISGRNLKMSFDKPNKALLFESTIDDGIKYIIVPARRLT